MACFWPRRILSSVPVTIAHNIEQSNTSFARKACFHLRQFLSSWVSFAWEGEMGRILGYFKSGR